MTVADYMAESGVGANAALVTKGGAKGVMKEMVKAVKSATLAVKAAKSAVKAARRTKRVCPRYCSGRPFAANDMFAFIDVNREVLESKLTS